MRERVRGYIRFLLENSLFLIGGTLIGLVWANTDLEGYETFTEGIHFFINDIAMAFFFGLAAKEVYEALLPGGALSSPRKAAMPLLATLGGMLGPASIYVAGALLLGQGELVRGWAIPAATDIAFSYLIARLVFGDRHPAIPFLLLLAIADDGGGLLILALFYPTGAVNLPLFAALVAAAIGIAIGLKRFRVTNFWPYIILCGTISWFGFYVGGIHPALALVPIIFFMPHEATDAGLFVEHEGATDTLNQFRDWWRTPVEIILGLFGLINAGVPFTSVGAGTWLVCLGLMLGKPLGITLFSLLGRAFNLSLPDGMRWADVIVLGCAAGIGFTVALFVSTVAFPPGAHLDMAKMGALFSFGSMAITLIAAKILRVKAMRTEEVEVGEEVKVV